MRRWVGLLFFCVCMAAVTWMTLYNREQAVWNAAGVSRERALDAECCGELDSNDSAASEPPSLAESAAVPATAEMSAAEPVSETTSESDNRVREESKDMTVQANETVSNSESPSQDTISGWEAAEVVAGTPASYQLSPFQNEEGSLTIRVLIGTSNYKNQLHDSVLVTSDSSFLMEGVTQDAVFAAGTEVDVTPAFLEQYGGRVTFSSEGHLYLANVERSCGHPDYPGTLECTNYSGKIGVVNELPLETYLERVVPGEMPSTYGMEALKAQAICARSYSCCQMLSKRFFDYRADVDDSTSSQVYNNQECTAETSEAVSATRGQVLICDGHIAEAYYYSTSCGYGADMSVWEVSPEKAKWVAASAMTVGRDVLNLSDEMSFRQFLESHQESWDSEYPWYRWYTDRSLAELSESIHAWLTAENRRDVGEISEISVTQRYQNGAAACLTVTGDEGTAQIQGADEIRRALGSTTSVIVQQDSREHSGMSLLPSAFFYLEKQADSSQTAYRIYGGGFGHGVGMSQDGANGMAAAGYSCESILSYFYRKIAICQIY